MLLDFIPEIDCESEEAGRIEYMLEDAGLLDALVVAPEQASAADALLADEGLSDCRLDIEGMITNSQRLIAKPQEVQRTVGHDASNFYGLRFDASVNCSPDGNSLDWEPIAATIVTALGENGFPVNTSDMQARVRFNNDGSWTHGLLTGRAGGGSASCIGKTTRLRVRQRELEEITRKRTQLDDELRTQTQDITHYEEQLAEIRERQTQLRKVFPNSGLEKIFAELDQSRLALESNRSAYQKAHLQTQEARQRFNNLTARLERDSNGITIFASDTQRVQD